MKRKPDFNLIRRAMYNPQIEIPALIRKQKRLEEEAKVRQAAATEVVQEICDAVDQSSVKTEPQFELEPLETK